ncbi:MAG: hypothetical protein ACM3JD_16275 [Rudaea sp.]
MSSNPEDSQYPTVPSESSVPSTGAQPAETALSDEFREFGRQLSALLRVVRESPRARDLEQQVTQAMREMEHQVDDAVANARERARVEDWRGTLKGAASTAADETQRGLAKGLRVVNERLARTIQEAERGRTQPAQPGTTPAPTTTNYENKGDNPPYQPRG